MTEILREKKDGRWEGKQNEDKKSSFNCK